MARNTFEAWIPEEYDSAVIQRVKQMSAVEAEARPIPMGSDTKSVPRSSGMDNDYITKGSAYGEDTSANDDVVLTAQKFGKALRVADEDIQDALASIIDAKSLDWATSYAKQLDNACLAVTATSVGAGVPFVSVYATVTSNGTGSASGYSANANYLNHTMGSTANGGDYASLSTIVGKVEQGDYFDESRTVVIAHTFFRSYLRNVKDTNGRPIFVQGVAGTPDTLFGLRIVWSLGAKTSATALSAPGGNPLLIVGNADYLLLGRRSGPESFFIPANTGLGALTDEAILKLRSRRGFRVGHPNAFAVLESS